MGRPQDWRVQVQRWIRGRCMAGSHARRDAAAMEHARRLRSLAQRRASAISSPTRVPSLTRVPSRERTHTPTGMPRRRSLAGVILAGPASTARRVCPYGNDPLTTESDDGLTEVHEVQAVIVGPNSDANNPTREEDHADRGYWSLTFTDNYGKEWTTRPIRQPGALDLSSKDTKDTTQHEVKAALMALPNHVIDDVEVSYEIADTSNTRYLITFVSAANQGNQHKLKCNFKPCDTDGCQPRLEGLKGSSPKCLVLERTNYQTASISGDYATAASLAKHGTGENTQCSNRGLCDGETGLCSCFDGFTGEACSIQTILV